ncbi:rCG63156 [Rattus norvegicus]|uniref:RCG63156 n=1 Tax=Rattus norvegicus TaxID=10116 RepID=A6K0N0_RAT|nr:rCG63156 [Rattus norvegicus]
MTSSKIITPLGITHSLSSPFVNVTELLGVVSGRSNLWATLHHDSNLPPKCYIELWRTTLHCTSMRNETEIA